MYPLKPYNDYKPTSNWNTFYYFKKKSGKKAMYLVELLDQLFIFRLRSE